MIAELRQASLQPQCCFECGAPAEYAHHVVPRSKGGSKTVPLCGLCHAKAHHRDKRMSTRALTAAALQHKKAQGELVGSVPYGSRLASDGRTLEPCPEEQEWIAIACELRAEGLSLRKIGAQLEARGMLPRRGGKWQATQISRLLAVEVAR